MDEPVIEPNLSIVVHDDDLPVGVVMSRIAHALSADFDVKCAEIAPKEIGMTIRYRLAPITGRASGSASGLPA
ncbi:hypothetical protein [Novosphingobium rosa]|uniref:hypothetical protein n=1 Tax=Novosphingobium rosa TaxID=76978 RepID=UPI000AB41E8E|nr:hypothetical protein [Novosphingobium rosa]